MLRITIAVHTWEVARIHCRRPVTQLVEDCLAGDREFNLNPGRTDTRGQLIQWNLLPRGNNYVTIILRGRAGYEVIDNQRGVLRRVGYNHFISSPSRIIVLLKTSRSTTLPLKHRFLPRSIPVQNAFCRLLFLGRAAKMYGFMLSVTWLVSDFPCCSWGIPAIREFF